MNFNFKGTSTTACSPDTFVLSIKEMAFADFSTESSPSPIVDLPGSPSTSGPTPPMSATFDDVFFSALHPQYPIDNGDEAFLIAIGLIDPPSRYSPQDDAFRSDLQRAIDLSFAEANPDPPPVKKRAKAPKAKAPRAKAKPKAKAPKAKRRKTRQTECPICLTGITRTTLVVTQCAHPYHRKCLDTWHAVRRNAGKKPNCPYCNTII